MDEVLPVALSTFLPDERVAGAMRKILEDCNWQVELDSEVVVKIDQGIEFETVLRIYYEQPSSIGFGPHYRVLVAIGGVKSLEFGVVEPRICFSLLYFSLDGNIITFDIMAPDWWVKN